ncbi:hypothetical protein ACFY12_03590 [Streptomyces sp. NPDC001339]|uniref:hypothetical protein n=1 Tax=Streptomyces sp. NPDC001339 TaxID=3364563 RepID=UPI0036A584DE
MAHETDHPLPFGKNARSRVFGWPTRARSAKPVEKRPPTEEEKAAQPPKAEDSAVPASTPQFQFSVDVWTQGKGKAAPALLRHVEAVEHCARRALPQERVAEAFMAPARPQFFSKNTKAATVARSTTASSAAMPPYGSRCAVSQG